MSLFCRRPDTINGVHMAGIDLSHKKNPIRILNAEPDGYCREAQELLCQIGQVDKLGPDESLSDRIASYEILVVLSLIHISEPTRPY